MPELPAEAAIREDERARIVAWLRELVGDVPRLVEWLHERDLHAGAGPLTVLRVAADAIGRGAGVGSPASCPSAAPESTQSPADSSVAPVYPPAPANPAEALSALRDRIAAAMAGSVDSNAFKSPHPAWEDFRDVWRGYADAALAALHAHQLASSHPSEHADLHRRYADAMWKAAEYVIVAELICCDPINPAHDLCVTGDAVRKLVHQLIYNTPDVASSAELTDAVLAVRDDELSRALRIADYHAGQHRQAADAIARVHQACHQALATPDAPDRWAVAAQVRAALEGPEQTGGRDG